MNDIYRDKYLKYKKKYIELKNQIGGFEIMDIKDGSNSIKINKLPNGTILDNLVAFLKNKGVNKFNTGLIGYKHSDTSFSINFESNSVAVSQKTKIERALKLPEADSAIKGKITITTAPVSKIAAPVSKIAAPVSKTTAPVSKTTAPVSKEIVALKTLVDASGDEAAKKALATLMKSVAVPTKASDRATVIPRSLYAKPWDFNAKKIFIAVVIDPDSQLGKVLNDRYNELFRKLNEDLKKVGKSEIRVEPLFKPINDKDKLTNPHITLLSFFFPEGGDIDKFLSVPANFEKLCEYVNTYFKDNFTDKKAQLHSEVDNYTQLTKFVARKFDNEPYLKNVKDNSFTPFKNSILSLFKKFNKVEENILPVASPVDPPETFTHYSLPSKGYPESGLAIGSFSSNWLPHMSIVKTTDTGLNTTEIIKRFKLASTGPPMSWLNLWPYNTSFAGLIPGKPTQNVYGSISHLHITLNQPKPFYFNKRL